MQPGWRRVPGQGRYARPERERRFLVRSRPVTHDARAIEDRYLDGTRLRLRAVRAGDEAVYKLTQKVRPDPDDPAEVALTNLYLTEQEHARLCALPAAVLTKTRSACGGGFVLDELHGHLDGLLLAEVEVDDLQAPLDLPAWVGDEVTSDDRWSGGRLARATPDEVRALLGG